MNRKTLIIFLGFMTIFFAYCSKKQPKDSKDSKESVQFIKDKTIETVTSKLKEKYGSDYEFRIEKGVQQVANFWRKSDGDQEKFKQFCKKHFIADEKELNKVFKKISSNLEVLYGNFHQIAVKLKEPIHLDRGSVHQIDRMFAEYNASSHLKQDFFKNKIAFYTLLNFPHYSLEQKNKQGEDWSKKQWAYARLGDLYTSRVPADLIQQKSETLTKADSYISEYNIFMGNLVDKEKNTYFPEDLRLITHWGLRDELKSNYNVKKNGLKKQEMIYQVMLDIINQDIPKKVINSDKYKWNPATDKLYKDGKEQDFKSEPNTRYQMLLNNFNAVKAIDPYQPYHPTYIKRAFEGNMEMTQPEVEKLFKDFVSSPQIKKVAKLIEKRLGRELQPFDIWYNGFSPNQSISEKRLDNILNKKYPTKEAFENDLPNILRKLGFSSDKSEFIASKVTVDPSRGAGHAWGAEMKSDVAHLRTRVGKDGMNYKGYNIAVHEFGHNVEQTITLHDVDYYMMNGVPNTAFTEAIAFLFQARDIQLLDLEKGSSQKQHLLALDNLWSAYEIMGVSLVDMNVWKWMYDNPNATKKELKEAVLRIAKDVWNKYYADVLGEKDSPILAIYSHMISSPLYLSAYPIGNLIHFQVEQHIEGKNLAEEITNMLKQGRLTPQLWMKNAMGEKVSNEPLLNASEKALKAMKE
jgi:hypothetical protein